MENEALLKLGRLQLEQYEAEWDREERLAQLKKSLPADQWKRLLALAVAYDEAAGAYHNLESVDAPDQEAAYYIGHAANLVDEAASNLGEAAEAIDPDFHDDVENLLDLANEEARLEWARWVVAQEQLEAVS